MDIKTRSLIAAGSAAAVNCRSCLEYHVPRCIKAGASENDVREAIETGFQIHRGAHAKTRGYFEGVIADAVEDINGPRPECCNSEETAARNGCC